MKRVSLGAARRYARALLDVAREKADPAALRAELGQAVAALASQKELQTVLAHPAVTVEKKKAILAAVFAEQNTSDLLRRLLALLAQADRVNLLPAIAESYAAALNAQNNVAAADVVSAVQLAPEQAAAVEGALKKATGMAIEMTTSIDSSLLGGVLVKIGGRHFDGSVRGRLRAMREHLGAQGS
jgi:F-type H+-transporting ATPase subunit delta